MPLFEKSSNFVTFLQAHPCARPWWVYIETAAPAFLKLWFTIATLDFEDFLREVASGKTGDPIGRKKGGTKHIRKGRYPEPENRVERFSQRGLKHLLMITEPLEKIGFAWLLYSATDEFFYDWQTLLENSAYCNAPLDTGPFMRSRASGSNVFIGPAGNATPLPILNQDRAGWGSGGFAVGLPPGAYTGIFTATITGPPGGLDGATAFIQTTNAVPGIIEGTRLKLGSSETISLFASGTFFIPSVFQGGSMAWGLRADAAVPAGVFCHGASAMCSLTDPLS